MTFINLDKWLKAQEEEQQIHCPYCGEQYDFSEKFELITYWGDSGVAVELECASCERDFFAVEIVTRTFKVTRNKS